MFIFAENKSEVMWREIEGTGMTLGSPQILDTKTMGVYNISIWDYWDNRVISVLGISCDLTDSCGFEEMYLREGDTVMIRVDGDLSREGNYPGVDWSSPVYNKPSFDANQLDVACGMRNWVLGKVKEANWYLTGCDGGRCCVEILGYRPGIGGVARP